MAIAFEVMGVIGLLILLMFLGLWRMEYVAQHYRAEGDDYDGLR